MHYKLTLVLYTVLLEYYIDPEARYCSLENVGANAFAKDSAIEISMLWWALSEETLSMVNDDELN